MPVLANSRPGMCSSPEAASEKREGGLWILGKRVALDAIGYASVSGRVRESICETLPARMKVHLSFADASLASHITSGIIRREPRIDFQFAETARPTGKNGGGRCRYYQKNPRHSGPPGLPACSRSLSNCNPVSVCRSSLLSSNFSDCLWRRRASAISAIPL